MNKMAADEENPSNSTATAITQQWEKDSRKDPEEEYFRLSCLALKIIYNEQDTDFVFTVSIVTYVLLGSLTFLNFNLILNRLHPGSYTRNAKSKRFRSTCGTTGLKRSWKRWTRPRRRPSRPRPGQSQLLREYSPPYTRTPGRCRDERSLRFESGDKTGRWKKIRQIKITTNAAYSVEWVEQSRRVPVPSDSDSRTLQSS